MAGLLSQGEPSTTEGLLQRLFGLGHVNQTITPGSEPDTLSRRLSAVPQPNPSPDTIHRTKPIYGHPSQPAFAPNVPWGYGTGVGNDQVPTQYPLQPQYPENAGVPSPGVPNIGDSAINANRQGVEPGVPVIQPNENNTGGGGWLPGYDGYGRIASSDSAGFLAPSPELRKRMDILRVLRERLGINYPINF